MKRFLLLSTILLVAATYALQAQTFLPYTAKDKDALKIVADTLKARQLSNAKLLLIGTGQFTFPNPLGGGNLEIEFDTQTGKSNGWIYAMQVTTKAKKDTVVLLAAGKIQIIGDLGLFGAVNAPVDQSILPLGPDSIPSTAMNSDAMATKLRANATFSAFHTANPTTPPKRMWLTRETSAPNDPYWTLNFIAASESMTCRIHAITGEVTCQAIATDVPEQTVSRNFTLQAYPNPASEGTFIRISPFIIRAEGHLSLYTVLGEKVQDFPYTPNSVNPGEVFVPLREFAPGMYILRYETAGAGYSVPLLINR